jgi:hypothetical protein|tara:strand:+ start:44 stop:181 length:138 start_codon:yes stop_codon:yes gene_type:complete
MARQINSLEYLRNSNVNRPGIHSKTKSSNHKKSKHYKKAYKGQGR